MRLRLPLITLASLSLGGGLLAAVPANAAAPAFADAESATVTPGVMT